MSAERRGLWVGAVAVFALRLMLSLSDPDLVHPVDPAELGHLDLLPAWLDGGLPAVVRLLGAADNVHHGGFLWLSIPVGVLRWLTGSDLLAVRGVAAMVAGVGWALWVEVARRAGGRVAMVGAGLCLAVPVPWFAQWTATLWGSHSEAVVFTGLWALCLARGLGPRWLGLCVGLGVAWDPLLWPTGLLVLSRRRHRQALVGLLAGWLLVRWPVLLSAPLSVLGASLTENPAHTPLQVMGGLLDPTGIGAVVGAWLPLPWVADGAPLSGLLTALAVLGAGVSLRRRGSGSLQNVDLVTILAVAPWVHLAVVVLLSPFRAQLAHRYLVAWWPALVVLPWLVPGGLRALALVPVASSGLAVPLLVAVAGDFDPSLALRYRSADFQRLGLDRVPVHRVDGVTAFLDAHPTGATPGFAAAFSGRWGYPVWGEDFPEQVRAAGLVDRWRTLSAAHDDAELAHDFGWGLAVACDGEPSCMRFGTDQLVDAGADAQALADGVGAGLRR